MLPLASAQGGARGALEVAHNAHRSYGLSAHASSPSFCPRPLRRRNCVRPPQTRPGAARAAAELARLHEQVNVYASTLSRYERELRDCGDASTPRRSPEAAGGRGGGGGGAEAGAGQVGSRGDAALLAAAAANEGCSSGASCASGGSCASAETDGLSTEERRRPFWTSGLGSKLVKRAAPPPPPDGGRRPPSAHAAAAGAANDLPPLPLPPIRPPAPAGSLPPRPSGCREDAADGHVRGVGGRRHGAHAAQLAARPLQLVPHRVPPPAPHAHERTRGAAALATAPPQARATADEMADAAAGGCRSSSATSWPAPAPENGAAAASGGDAGGGWHVVTALVRRLVTESADGGVRPEPAR